MRLALLMAASIGLGQSAPAQSPEALVAQGRDLADLHPREALRLFEQALALDSTHYEGNWRAATALANLGQEISDQGKSATRDSLYQRAVQHARRAIATRSDDAEGYFVLAMALGRTALTKGKRDRVRYAVEIRDLGLRALELKPNHDGAHHVLGLWHAEVMRLSGFNRFFAKNFLGGKVFGQASWAEATRHLEDAVRLDSSRIFHRLDLARVYADRALYAQAQEQLQRITELPDRVALDKRYREEAARLLEEIHRRRRDR